MPSFQAKIGWKMMKREQIKIIIRFRSYPMHNGKFQKIAKILKILKKYHYGVI